MSNEQNEQRNELVPDSERGLITQSVGLAKRTLRLASAIYSKPAVEKAFAGESKRAIQIALERPKYWEYLLTAELLKSKLELSKSKFDSWQRGIIHTTPVMVSGQELITWIGAAHKSLRSMGEHLQSINKELNGSWGLPGESRDPLKIKDVVDKIVNSCDIPIRLLIELQSRTPPKPFHRIKEIMITLLVHIANEHIAEFERAADELSQPLVSNRTIKVSFHIPDEILQVFNTEMARLNQMALSRQIDPFSKPKGT